MRIIVIVTVCLATICAPAPAAGQTGAPNGEWRTYGGDEGHSKYAPLDQITKDNVKRLQVAWRWTSIDEDLKARAKASGDAALKYLSISTYLNESTPLMVKGVLYTATSYGQIAAIDARTGTTLWSYDPGFYKEGRPPTHGFMTRGLSYWTDGKDERVFWAGGLSHLLSIDVRTGKPDPRFGENGLVDLATGLGRAFNAKIYSVDSPPLVVRDVVIVGSNIPENISGVDMPPGHVRAFDVRTGRLNWTFHTIPQPGEARVQMLSEELDSKTHIRVVGESAAWRDVLKKATQVAETDTTVLVTGESGTGKEVVARFIYRASARSRGPFVALNCAALPEQLLESELFGYERGAFTSAQQAKPGQIELAANGVLFLDEVTEMSLAAQAKFLRVLQEREFQRLGATRIQKADIRVIAATNRDLRKAVERGDFREDLYYRLKVFDIGIPPLRERSGDILPIGEALLRDIGKSFARPPAGLTRDAREALLRYHWPGNVRELRNALERAAILCEGGLIRPEHLALEATGKPPGSVSTDLGTIERDTIVQVLGECRWNRTRAAKRLGLTRTQLYLRLQKYGLEKPPEA